MFASKKKDKEDDEDSGFRSRVNSVTQSCSPASSSAFSSEGGSPQRKISTSEVPDSANSYTLGEGKVQYVCSRNTAEKTVTGYGTGPTYGQQLFHPFDSIGDGARDFVA
ncbi:hypothetical protein ANCDUO_01217 [Ancylostoma duodenale]|uniref:Uncharacterized protein n=1 Tax=Ancylostoma duodenale TaxID=51022 RepID=A0A0C2H3Q3_9BILA|nr:hypothetical protein ANCDUO_01217 [Ancylostoma duodenale]